MDGFPRVINDLGQRSDRRNPAAEVVDGAKHQYEARDAVDTMLAGYEVRLGERTKVTDVRPAEFYAVGTRAPINGERQRASVDVVAKDPVTGREANLVVKTVRFADPRPEGTLAEAWGARVYSVGSGFRPRRLLARLTLDQEAGRWTRAPFDKGTLPDDIFDRAAK